jgi:hypothetical protein
MSVRMNENDLGMDGLSDSWIPEGKQNGAIFGILKSGLYSG